MPANNIIVSELAVAERLAARGKIHEMLYMCESLNEHVHQDPDLANRAGNLLLSVGYLSKATDYFSKSLELDPANIAAQAGLAQIAHDSGKHREARQRYNQLASGYPNDPVIRRNALLSAEYDPTLTDQERFSKALEWGKWAQQHVPKNTVHRNRLDPSQPIRIGYVSADLCQHTVGLLVKDIITNHNPTRIKTFVYNATPKEDWITKEIRSKTAFREVLHLNDDALERLIRQDRIDLLVDLSGHTAGSRLSVFARKPAPIQVSWLGYFASTGLETIDAVLLDEGHTNESTQFFFCEKILKLSSRFYFSPLQFYPEVLPPPCSKNGYITFGSFNNTAKINVEVIKVWSSILNGVTDSKLILKWRTYIDPVFRQNTLREFGRYGIDPKRIELRGASFHQEALNQYADIDVALDPFPFTGGLSSLEALWMGVPIVTLTGSRVVNRQTSSILSAIGMEDWVAQSQEDYIRKATELSENMSVIVESRGLLRSKMRCSDLMQKKQTTDQLEHIYKTLVVDLH